jgi:serine/threonine protein kinase
VFVSYSHKDSRACGELLTHLAPLKVQGRLAVWSDRELAPGDRWSAEIDRALSETRIAIMLVSPAFLESRFVTEVEIPRLLSAAETNGVTVVCVYVEYSVVQQVVFSGVRLTDFQGANSPDRPLADLSRSERMKALRDVALRVLSETDRQAEALAAAAPQATSAPPPAAPAQPAGPVREKPVTAAPELAIPRHRLDAYEILHQISAGPNGYVFKCRVPQTGAICVVKRTDAEKVDLRAQEHLASLSLPNIATPRRVWTEGDFVCEELPYVGGTRLSDAVPASIGGIRGSLLENFFSQMQKALKPLHEVGLVHRDIHPDNIYLCVSNPDDETDNELGDLGFESDEIGLRREYREPNRMLRNAGELRRVAFVLVDCTFAIHESGGVPVPPVMHDSFTPLEQILGLPTAASDLYALGATLYYVITGSEMASYRDRTSDSIRLHPVDTRTGQDFDIVLEALLARSASARRFDHSIRRSSMGSRDCGTLALSDGQFCIANSISAYSRVISRSDALALHIAAEARAKEWLESHRGNQNSVDEYERRLYESNERNHVEHAYWVRTLTNSQ